MLRALSLLVVGLCANVLVGLDRAGTVAIQHDMRDIGKLPAFPARINRSS